MNSNVDDDWSDSDSDAVSEVETSVLLGVPDGPIQVASELCDAAVSRIGGHPAFLPAREPSISSSQCKVCSFPMELLVQMWCPFEDSPMDRALYIWGCARSGCQRKEGSVRAWRGLRYNEKYAAKLERKLAKRREQAEVEARAKEQAAKASNPFSLKSSSPGPANSFGLGAQIFGDNFPSTPHETVSETSAEKEGPERSEDDDSDNESTSSEQSLLTAIASTSLEESPWKSAPAYPPLYLSTASEYLPPQPKQKVPSGVRISDPADGEGGKDISWAFEPYENSLQVDQAFERFTKRVGYEGEQCVRYELKGTPLPFSSDKVFESLFPAPPSPLLPVTKPDFKVVHIPKRIYSPTTATLPPCPHCKSKRVFECQLMPNLINVLRNVDHTEKQLTDEQRHKAVRQTLKGEAGRGMDWGTCMIFSCENDCRLGDGGEVTKDVWREETVLVQWDI